MNTGKNFELICASLKQVEKAAQQMEPNNNIQQPAKPAAQPAVAQPAKQDSNSQKTASATAPNYAETSEPLELKGIKIGMTAQELLKLYPQAKVKTYGQQSAEWVFADQLVSLGFQDEVYLGIKCGGGRNAHSVGKSSATCTTVTVLGIKQLGQTDCNELGGRIRLSAGIPSP